MKRTKYLLLVLLFFSCRNHLRTKTSFYYWKHHFHLTGYEKNFLKEKEVSAIYFKCFDVVQNRAPKPEAVLLWKDHLPTDVRMIPVVFIENRVFVKNDSVQIQAFVKNVSRLLRELCADANVQYHEIQIDCDWTAGSKDIYFYFLSEMKRENEKKLSATLRLHQIKYRKKSGVPPVDEGVLMCYNMGNMKDVHAVNSIYEKKVLESYIHNVGTYPIPLRSALPIFSWQLIYRGNNFLGIHYGLNDSLLHQNFEPKGKNKYLCREAFDSDGFHFIPGDILRKEFLTVPELKEAQKVLSLYRKDLGENIIYFDLDSARLIQYEKVFNP